MKRSILSYIITGMMLLFALSIMGCGSESGAIVEEIVPVAQSYDETCGLCHSSGSLADVAEMHRQEEESSPVAVSITAVREVNVAAGDNRLELDLELSDSGNPLIPIAIESASNIRFSLVKLDTSGGGSGNWKSYINSSETKNDSSPGTGPNGTYTQATTARGNTGVLTNTAPGAYTYRFSFNMNSVTDPVSLASITYDRAATHRIAIQFGDNVDNAFVDFVPNTLPALTPVITRNIVLNSSCNECHIALGFHGGDRINVNYCVTCHNPGSTDANSGGTVDFKVMIHKIHRGENLPAVEAGGEYAIWGYGGTKYDYSAIVFPQDIRNCTKCHRGVADSDNWKNSPSMATCTACHDAPTDSEYAAFPALTAQQIMDAHEIPEQVAAESIKFNIISATATAVSSGAYDVTIQFSFIDPTNGDALYDFSDTSTVDFTGLSFLVGWDTSDYTNKESGAALAQPVRKTMSGATDTGGHIYRITATAAIPAGTTGSGVVALQGYPLMDLDNDGAVDDNVPVTSVVKSFAITDTSAQNRRSIVDINKCNNCHGYLSLHGGNRNNEPQVCVICHNADATDKNRRPADISSTSDGKAEESVDFKYMIHAIHAGQSDIHGFREKGIVVYGFGNTEHDYSHVSLPSLINNIMNCEGCHKSGTFEVPLDDDALPTTVDTGDDVADPDDDSNITPTASVCSSCHDSIEPKTHMASEGGVFDFKAFTLPVSSSDDQASVCGPGPVSSQPAGHVSRLDCCSCHSPR